MIHDSSRVRLLLVALLSAVAVGAQGRYDEQALASFRADRQKALLADGGWFTVSGLHFLAQGDNRFGADPSNDIVLKYPDMPARAGVITMRGTTVTVRGAGGKPLVLNGVATSSGPLRLAAAGRPPDLVTFGRVAFFLHFSGPRLAIRVRDRGAPLRTGFSGLKWYAPDPSHRVTGRFTPLPAPRVVQAPTILGDLEPFTVAGTASFELAGKPQTMEAWRSGGGLWFVFRDLTSADTTYPSARFLYTEAPSADGTVVMDFNRAENPPCAYNPWTTCPLPPRMNRLQVRIEAGEKRYHKEETSNLAVLGK